MLGNICTQLLLGTCGGEEKFGLCLSLVKIGVYTSVRCACEENVCVCVLEYIYVRAGGADEAHSWFTGEKREIVRKLKMLSWDIEREGEDVAVTEDNPTFRCKERRHSMCLCTVIYSSRKYI